MEGVEERDGDLFQSTCQTWVCPVNTQGVMGKGVALAFKQRFPALFPYYQHACQTGLLTVTRPWLYRPVEGPWVLCFATKDHWRNPSQFRWIEAGMRRLINQLPESGITSLAFPALGCGLGGLNWPDVRYLFYHYFDSISMPVEVYRPTDKPWYSYPCP